MYDYVTSCDLPRPYLVLLASAMASFGVLNVSTVSTGPNIWGDNSTQVSNLKNFLRRWLTR